MRMKSKDVLEKKDEEVSNNKVKKGVKESKKKTERNVTKVNVNESDEEYKSRKRSITTEETRSKVWQLYAKSHKRRSMNENESTRSRTKK